MIRRFPDNLTDPAGNCDNDNNFEGLVVEMDRLEALNQTSKLRSTATEILEKEVTE
jgi:hypothetical protein